jgi:NADH-quinone oxidoreductase subunit F
MENDPHSLIEGCLIAGLAVDAHAGYVYIRGEYRYLIEILEKALAEAYAKGWLGKNIQGTGFDFDLYAHTGAGSYECGEESALLESLEGKRGVPRIRPPFPAVSGAFQCPSVLNNVETFCAVPHILLGGGKAFADLGVPKAGGTKLTALSGHINRPGVYELRLGFPVRQLIEEVGGGIPNGKKLKAFIPGGSSCPILTAAECEGATMDYDSMASRKSMLGSGGVIIMDEDTSMVKVGLRLMRFYSHESCGWCIPCREGTTWLTKIMTRFYDGNGSRADIDLLGDIAKNMLGRTFCPLGDAAALPMISLVEKFRDEFEDYLKGKRREETSGRLVTV